MDYCFAPFSAPDWFDDEWMSKIRHDTGDNRRLKVSRWISLLSMQCHVTVVNGRNIKGTILHFVHSKNHDEGINDSKQVCKLG